LEKQRELIEIEVAADTDSETSEEGSSVEENEVEAQE
jgi:hypothetical protein